MYAIILLVHKIAVSLFLFSYIVRLIGLLGNIQAINTLYSRKFMRMLVDMFISTAFLITGVFMLLKMPSALIDTMIMIKIALVFISIPVAIIGFKRNKKALATLSVLLLLGAYGMGEMHKKRPMVNENMVRTSVDAVELFKAANCNTCHGENGNQPNVAIGAVNLSTSKITDEQIIQRISNGKNNMPGYKKRLKEDQIKMLAEYVKTLRK